MIFLITETSSMFKQLITHSLGASGISYEKLITEVINERHIEVDICCIVYKMNNNKEPLSYIATSKRFSKMKHDASCIMYGMDPAIHNDTTLGTPN